MTERFGIRLKELRKTAGLTQSELSEKINVHLQTVSKWERDLFEPDISILGELAALFSVSLERLCGVHEVEKTYTGTFRAVDFGKAVAQLRKKNNQSQEDLAAVLQVGTDTVSKWERGVTCPDLSRFVQLAAHFKQSVSQLYYAVPDEEEPVEVVRKRRFPALIVSICTAVLAAVGLFVVLLMPPQEQKIDQYSVIIDDMVYEVKSNEWFVPQTPTKNGYRLTGYETEEGEPVVFPCRIEKDQTVVPLFEPITYTVDYWTGGGTLSNDVITSFTIEDGEILLEEPTKEVAVFEGWYTTSDFSGEAIDKISFTGGDVTLYAKWSDGAYTIRYVLNGGFCHHNPDTATKSNMIELQKPQKNGYLFLGWYDSLQGGTKYEFVGGENAKSITLYALWQKSEVVMDVTYELNGGETEGINPDRIAAGETYPLYPATKIGHDFVGWFVDPADNGDPQTTVTYQGEKLTLYAIFKPKDYVIRYEYDGVYEGKGNPNVVLYGESVTLNPVILRGHDFVGWYTQQDGGDKVEQIDKDNVMTISMLYARFSPCEYQISCDADGGTFAVEGAEKFEYVFSVRFGTEFVLPECSKDGYDFVGWQDGAGNLLFSIPDTSASDRVLTAKYVKSEGRAVAYVLDGGSLSEENPERVYYGIDKPLNNPSKANHHFLGWCDSSDGNGTYHKQISYGDGSPLTLYAIYQPIRTNGNVEDFAYEQIGNEITITKYLGKFGETVDLIIPALIGGLPVTTVGDGDNSLFALSNYIQILRSLVIPEGVVTIANRAFSHTNEFRLEQPIVIPSTVTTIGNSAFGYPGSNYDSNERKCTVRFAPNSKLERIGVTAFFGIVSNEVLELPLGLKIIGESAFEFADLPGVLIPGSVEEIGESAFCGVSGYSDPNSNKFISTIWLDSSSLQVVYRSSFERVENLFVSSTKEEYEKVLLGKSMSYRTAQVFAVPKVTLTLNDDGKTTMQQDKAFILPDCVKAGYRFVGWQTEDGEWASRLYVPCKNATLTAVYEKKTENDGREGEPMFVSVGDTVTYSFRAGETFAFVIDVALQTQVMIRITCSNRVDLDKVLGTTKDTEIVSIQTISPDTVKRIYAGFNYGETAVTFTLTVTVMS